MLNAFTFTVIILFIIFLDSEINKSDCITITVALFLSGIALNLNFYWPLYSGLNYHEFFNLNLILFWAIVFLSTMYFYLNYISGIYGDSGEVSYFDNNNDDENNETIRVESTRV